MPDVVVMTFIVHPEFNRSGTYYHILWFISISDVIKSLMLNDEVTLSEAFRLFGGMSVKYLREWPCIMVNIFIRK